MASACCALASRRWWFITSLTLALPAWFLIGPARTPLDAESPLPVVLAKAPTPPMAKASGKIKFNRDIRQLLSDNCYHCHGPDDKHREAELRLDNRDAAITAKAILPGKPDDSELIRRIMSNDPDTVMPPPDTNKKLTAEQKRLFTDWVRQGAEYEAHWSFTPLTRPGIPTVGDAVSVANPIDAFILAELREAGIAPSPPADRAVLLRRLSLDLIGLPPTPQQITEFLADQSADAYAKQVDRLLADPAFGERWAVWWFDVARFSDTVGFHGDQNQRIFPYRDYVINSFNRNKPFDQFTREQLAGDLLPNPTTEQLIATGFNRLNMMTREGGAQPKEYLAKYQADRVRTIGSTWLGATLGCCECHNHKFDPFTQRDFYSISAFFADVKQWGVYSDYGYSPNPELKGFNNDYPFPPELLVDSPFLQRRLERLRTEFDKLAAEGAATQARAQWKTAAEKFVAANPTGWLTAVPRTVEVPIPPEKADNRKSEKPSPKGKSSAADKAATANAGEQKPQPDSQREIQPTTDGFVIPRFVKENPVDAKSASVARFAVTGGEIPWQSVRVELGTSNDPKQPVKRNSLKVTVSIVNAQGKARPVSVLFAAADHYAPRYSSGAEIYGVHGGWNIPADKHTKPATAVYLLDQPATLKPGEELRITLAGEVSPVRVSVSPFASAEPIRTRPEVAAESFSAFWANPDPARNDLRERAKKLHRDMIDCNSGKAWTLITQAVDKPLPTRIFPRGNWQDESQPELTPATISFLPGLPNSDGRKLTRLDLADWICSPQNPLTARTLMNRLWKEFFGRGISQAVDDLGAQGDAPSHPELLDWLAVEFRDGGWDFKQSIRTLVLSKTYQQSSRTRPELRNIDPLNRLLAFQNPRRLDAEFIRDNALFIADLLNREMGGPSVKPYQPADYYDQLQFPNRKYMPDLDERQYRRGVYIHWQRTFLHPMLANFDAPSREECTAARVSSNTPQQALTLLNDPTLIEAARALAVKLQLIEPDINPQSKLERLFTEVLGRKPVSAESAGLLKFLDSQRDEFSSGRSDAAKLLKVGITPLPELSDEQRVELAAWTSVCRVMLNLHETITRY